MIAPLASTPECGTERRILGSAGSAVEVRAACPLFDFDFDFDFELNVDFD